MAGAMRRQPICDFLVTYCCCIGFPVYVEMNCYLILGVGR